MKTIVLIAPPDGSKVNLSVVRYVGQWLKGKCWSAFCGNPIWFVHLSRTGKADVGYCYGCYHWRALSDHVRELSRQGSWHLLLKGGLEEWSFNETIKSPGPAKGLKQ